jgi:low affinity Fe/Cu permease
MVSILSVGAAEYWTATTITAWTVGIATVITAFVTLYKVWVAQIESRSKDRIDLAKSQIEYLVKPMRDDLDSYRKRIEALEDERIVERRERYEERKERSAERVLFEEHKTIITIFADHFTILYKWIDENIIDRKTPIPELPPKLQVYQKGEIQ